jgi:hypothetical protein
MAKFGTVNTGTEMSAAIKTEGGHLSTVTTYVSGTGTAGTSNSAMTVISRTLAANTLTQLGDRLRVRVYFFANTAAPIIATLKIGPAAAEVTISHVTHSGGAASGLTECWLHYIDNTHANIIEGELGVLGALTAPNVAGFAWNGAQNVLVTQDAVVGNYITVYGVFVDVLPLGVI